MTATNYDILPSGTVRTLMTRDRNGNGAAPGLTPLTLDVTNGDESPAWLRPAARVQAQVEPEAETPPVDAAPPTAVVDAVTEAVAAALQGVTARIDELAAMTVDLVRAQSALDERMTALADEVRTIRRRTPLQARRQD
jgi:hypothetical protein